MMNEHEKLIGLETMKARIELFHFDRLKRIGRECQMDFFRTAGWSRAKILKEFRELPENAVATQDRVIEFAARTPRTDAEMAEIMKSSRSAALMMG